MNSLCVEKVGADARGATGGRGPSRARKRAGPERWFLCPQTPGRRQKRPWTTFLSWLPLRLTRRPQVTRETRDSALDRRHGHRRVVSSSRGRAALAAALGAAVRGGEGSDT